LACFSSLLSFSPTCKYPKRENKGKERVEGRREEVESEMVRGKGEGREKEREF
jgi:hypothetical protein